MKLTVLGCGDAFGNGGRNNTSFLLTQDVAHVMVDCGTSTLIRLKQEGIDLNQIGTIVISHFHGDHFGGIPFFLISSLFESVRSNPLTIIGPKGVENRVLELLETMYPGTVERLSSIDLRFCEFLDSNPLMVNEMEISAWSVEHSPPAAPHGLRLKWSEKTFAFSGDTSWTENLIPMCDQADLFICECNFLNHQAYGHLSYKELVEKRRLLNCENIWLSHMGNDVLSLKDAVFSRLEDGQKIIF